MQQEKHCQTCDLLKPVSQFYRKGAGHTAHCIECTKQKYRTTAYREYQRKYQATHTTVEEGILNRSKSRAKRKGFEHNIGLEDIQVPDVCPLLGIPLFVGDSKVCPNSPSLDRIDPSKGYVKGNVWVISYKANTIKSNATVDELIKITNGLSNLNSD